MEAKNRRIPRSIKQLYKELQITVNEKCSKRVARNNTMS